MLKPKAIYFEHCDPGWVVPESTIANHILLLVTNGCLNYTVETETLTLKKGDALFVPMGVLRSANNNPSHAHEMYVAHFHDESHEETLPLLTHPKLMHIHTNQYEYMKQRFSSLTQHWLRKLTYSAVLCHSILLEMLAILNEEADTKVNLNKSFALVSDLQNQITLHYRKQITVAELAEHVQRTPNYVSRIFKETTGITITQYINQIRIAAACDLLANSQMNVGEVSDFLGFCEQSYFNRVFKRLTGTRPSAYLKEKVKVWNDIHVHR